MSGKEEKESCCKLELMKPMNMTNVTYHYLPIFGAVNYAALSVNVMHPSLISKICPSRDVTNVLLANSVVGTSLYLHNRSFMKKASTQNRIIYSAFGAVMFNFGSVLVWAVLRTVTRSQCIATIIGILSGVGLVSAGRNCVQYIDAQIAPATKK